MSIIEERLTANKNRQQKRELNVTRIKVLKNDGYSNKEIGRVVGLSESTIRLILKKSQEQESKQN